MSVISERFTLELKFYTDALPLPCVNLSLCLAIWKTSLYRLN
jgi:hypothetical protein